ncbi:MAG: hypothetical protein H7Y07_15250 [Pyrinomonadaceae bacterium]|nr:hypothetical protein [Sphingobacteriaceae bacterium]
MAIICYKRLKGSFMLLFIPFLGLTLLSELSSSYIHQMHGASTTWIYKILNPLSQCFYAYIFYELASDQKFRKIILILVSLYFLICVYYYLKDDQFNSYLIVAGGLMQIIFACGFFYQCLKNDEYFGNNAWNSGLWIASGVLIFYAGIAIVFSLFDYIRLHKLELNGMSLYHIIPRALSIVLYSCLSISFLVWKHPRKI